MKMNAYQCAWLEKSKGYFFRCYHRAASKWWHGAIEYQRDREDYDDDFYEWVVAKWMHHRTRLLYWLQYPIALRIEFAKHERKIRNWKDCNWCLAKHQVGPDNFSGRCNACYSDVVVDAKEGRHITFRPFGEYYDHELDIHSLHHKIQAWVEHR